MSNWLTKLAYRIWDWIMGIDPKTKERLEYYCRRKGGSKVVLQSQIDIHRQIDKFFLGNSPERVPDVICDKCLGFGRYPEKEE